MNELPTGFILTISAFLGGIFLLKKIGKRSPPKNEFFICRRCSKSTRHSSRTFEAQSQGKKGFFCNTCHRQWLTTQPTSTTSRTFLKKEPSGCLGSIVLGLSIPISGLALIIYLAN